MSNSGTHRSQILQDLDSVKPKFGYEYHSVTSTSEYFVQPNQPLAESFKATLESISGSCVLCKTTEQALSEAKKIIENETVYCNNQDLYSLFVNHAISYEADSEVARTAKISITSCEALSVRTASVIVSSTQIIGRRAIAAAEIHIVIAYQEQLCEDLPQAIAVLEKKYGANFPSQITVITGPSRTADIEKTLVLGAHGPKKLVVLLIQKSEK